MTRDLGGQVVVGHEGQVVAGLDPAGSCKPF